MTHITVLSGGVGGARFLRGVRAWARQTHPDGAGGSTAHITAIVNTGDDMWLTGLRITPDLDSIMYTLAGANDEERGWGRVGETERVSGELKAYGVGWPWFTLGDLDIGTHLARTHFLRSGMSLSAATERILQRWDIGVRLLPMTDDEVETHVVSDIDGTEMHFQEWWTRHRASIPAREFRQLDVERSTPAPGVLDAIAAADVVLVAPSNPVVSIGTILGIPGIRAALAATSAPVVGVSPIINGSVVRGMADACLQTIGVATAADSVAVHYGSRAAGGLLDAWLIDEADAAVASHVEAAGIATTVVPLWMRDVPTAKQLAADAMDAATRVRSL
ncbi:LPPG:FO 2-phospho-L-lactate transferase [Glaciihabitans tibetensis]|uniref:LPPG:FO 2-phospho-L-lactate transferase n=1 Tax=Glaciihabitans tibetensis TaxID=1266600 RepID=A0A2T0VI83_9MICO|nr:2-phospho-L-lactate transferase [Glaciihabitans tibetensis]PRY69893.1 LPPG:FO 2-phospho-L-lactate transferase [Glaciihabitans tibetensis]